MRRKGGLPRSLVAVGLALLAVACAPAPPSPGPGGTTPGECLRKLRDAERGSDWGAYYDNLAPSLREGILTLAVKSAAESARVIRNRGLEIPPVLESFRLGLATGGIDLDEVRVQLETDPGAPAAAVARVRDKRELFRTVMADIVALADKSRTEYEAIESVTVDGDRAPAVILVRNGRGELRRVRGMFLRTGDRWFLDESR